MNRRDVGDGVEKMGAFVRREDVVKRWYLDPEKSPEDLLQLVTKYSSKEGLNHRKVLNYCHPKFSKNENFDDVETNELKNLVIKYHLHGFDKVKGKYDEIKGKSYVSEMSSRVVAFMDTLEEIRSTVSGGVVDKDKIISLIGNTRVSEPDISLPEVHNLSICPARFCPTSMVFEYEDEEEEDTVVFTRASSQNESPKFISRLRIVMQHLPESVSNNRRVLQELIKDMPMWQLLRNISRMLALHMFEDGNGDENFEILKEKLGRLSPCRIHPLQVLKAYMENALKRPSKLSRWKLSKDRHHELSEILENTYFASWKPKMEQIHDTEDIKCVACVDCNKSMNEGHFLGYEKFTGVRVALAILSAMEVRVPQMNFRTYLCGHATPLLVHQGKVELLGNTMLERLQEAKSLQWKNSDLSDLSLPIKDFLNNGDEDKIGVFIIFTKSEKALREESPYDIFKDYVKNVNKDAKLIICCMGATTNVIADPIDPNVKVFSAGDSNLILKVYEAIR